MITAGGTGGHVYPALAVTESIVRLYDDAELYFVGTVNGFERPLVENYGIYFFSYDEVQAGPIHGVNPLRMLTSLLKLLVGTTQAFKLLLRHKPQAILSTGGWASLPVALAARFLHIPMLIYLPDVEPGLTIKVLRLFAKRVAITVEESAQYFKAGQTIVTGYPLREKVKLANRKDAQMIFGLDPSRKTLLIFGGSRGARAINMCIARILPDILASGHQVIHVTGKLEWERTQEQLGDLAGHADYHGFDYLDEMGMAFAAADLVVCRAGASILGEFPLFALPSILIPMAYSWHYQQVNAEYLAKRGAAIHLDERDMEQKLLPTIQQLLNDPQKLAEIGDYAAKLAQPDGSDNLARALAELCYN